MGNDPKATLLTGLTSGLVSQRLLEKILAAPDEQPVICAVLPAHVAEARARVAAFEPRWRERVEIFACDIAAMDFGLSGNGFAALAQRVEAIYHCYSTIRSGLDAPSAEREYLRATGEVLELAKSAAGLKRLIFGSSAFISGSRSGVVMEDELIRPPRFHSAAQEALFRAERLVRATRSELPVIILRPSLLVGAATNGNAEPFDELHLFIQFILNSPPDIPVLLPKRGQIFLHAVFTDFAIDAAWAIANDPSAIGRTFHLVDSQPLKAAELVELVAKSADRAFELGDLPEVLAAALLRVPGLNRWLELPRTLLERLAMDAIYDTTNANAILQRNAICCPCLPSYLNAIIERAKSGR